MRRAYLARPAPTSQAGGLLCLSVSLVIDAPRTTRLLRAHLKEAGKVGPLFGGDLRKGGRSVEALDYTTVLHHFERYLARTRGKRPGLFEKEVEPVTIHRLRHAYLTAKPTRRPILDGSGSGRIPVLSA